MPEGDENSDTKPSNSFQELMDLREWKNFKVGQLVEINAGNLIQPWKENNQPEVGVITGFFLVEGTTNEVKGSPIASSFIGAHVLIKSVAHKYHLDHLKPIQ